jgi:hypothetical protein
MYRIVAIAAFLFLSACGAPDPETPRPPVAEGKSMQANTEEANTNKTFGPFASLSHTNQAAAIARYKLIQNTEIIILNLVDQYQNPSNLGKDLQTVLYDMFNLCKVHRHNPYTDLKTIGLMNLAGVHNSYLEMSRDRCPITLTQKVDFYAGMGLAKSSLEMESIYSSAKLYANEWRMRGEVTKKSSRNIKGVETIQFQEKYSAVMESKRLGKIPYTKFVLRTQERVHAQLERLSTVTTYVIQSGSENIEIKRQSEWLRNQVRRQPDSIWINGEKIAEGKLFSLLR